MQRPRDRRELDVSEAQQGGQHVGNTHKLCLFKGLGLPPQGTGRPWQGFEQGKDGVRFVLQQDPSGFLMEGE